MAEFNLFMGTARKSVGDVTLMRRAGRQIARVRLRTISNPKTEAQATQRNFVAPVARFYAPFKHTLKRSWEGLNTDQSYNKFLSTNVDLARKEQWFLVKGSPWMPLPYQLSFGSLKPFPYSLIQDGEGLLLNFISNYPDDDDVTCANVSYWLIDRGLKEGDVITIICVGKDSNNQYQPYTAQFTLNLNDRRSMSVFMGDTIDMYAASYGLLIALNGMTMVAGSVLYARRSKGQWLRSTQFLSCSDAYTATLVSQDAREAAIASYQTPNSDEGGGVYPGGDDNLFNVAAADGRALLFIGGQYTAQVVTYNSNKLIQLKADNYDHWYYIVMSDNHPLGTNAAGSTNPSDWRGINMPLTDDMLANNIPVPDNGTMYQYLQSIGWSGS